MNEKRKRPNHTREFKVRLVLEHGYSTAEVGRRLGTSGSNVSRWVREYRRDQDDTAEDGVSRRELEAENCRLKKENKRLQMECEILKKAAAFFA